MKKKVFTTVAIALLVVLTAGLLVACGNALSIPNGDYYPYKDGQFVDDAEVLYYEVKGKKVIKHGTFHDTKGTIDADGFHLVASNIDVSYDADTKTLKMLGRTYKKK
jgi:hypothetical protein